jgi:protein TonB
VDTPGEGVYIESLTRKIRGNSRYPEYARRTGQGGTVELVFAVQENGDVENVKLLKSSGFIVLDVEALRNVRESAPFGSVPARADPGPLTVRLTFSYKLPDAPDGAR